MGVFAGLLLPVLAYLLSKRRRQNGVRFSAQQLFEGVAIKSAKKPGLLSWVLLFLPIVCLIVALARPQKVTAYSESTSTGIDIVIALDIFSLR